MQKSFREPSWKFGLLVTFSMCWSLGLGYSVRAAEPEAAAKPAAAAPAVQKGILDRNHLLGPGDVIDITVDGYPQFSRTVKLFADGSFDYPILTSMNARGLTVKELKEQVTEGFRKELRRPIVYVSLQDIYIPPPPPPMEVPKFQAFGAVGRKGDIEIPQPKRLHQIIESLGLSERADRTSIRIRYPDGTARTIDVSSFAQTGEIKDDILIKGGEEIVVVEKPEAPKPEPVKIQILGHVVKTGYLQFDTNPPLLEALDKAGGPKPGASLERIKVINGGKEQIVDIGKYMAGDVNANYLCKNGDVILLAEKPLKVLVFGEVQHPGDIAIDEDKTLAEVVLEAGLSGNADRRKVELIRELPNGKVERKTINVTEIERQKKDDVKLQRGDVLFVPSKSGARGILGFLGKVAAPLWLMRSIVPGFGY